MLKRSDSIAMNDFRTELDVLQKVSPELSAQHCKYWTLRLRGRCLARQNVDECYNLLRHQL